LHDHQFVSSVQNCYSTLPHFFVHLIKNASTQVFACLPCCTVSSMQLTFRTSNEVQRSYVQVCLYHFKIYLLHQIYFVL